MSAPLHAPSMKFERPMKPATKRVLRACVKSVGIVDLLDAALVHHRDTIGSHHRLGLIVRDVNRRDAEFVVQPPDLKAHFFAQIGVEIGERFVEQQHSRLDDDGAGQGHALLLSATELGRVALGQVAHMDHVQHLVELACGPHRREACATCSPNATFCSTVMFGQMA